MSYRMLGWRGIVAALKRAGFSVFEQTMFPYLSFSRTGKRGMLSLRFGDRGFCFEGEEYDQIHRAYTQGLKDGREALFNVEWISGYEMLLVDPSPITTRGLEIDDPELLPLVNRMLDDLSRLPGPLPPTMISQIKVFGGRTLGVHRVSASAEAEAIIERTIAECAEILASLPKRARPRPRGLKFGKPSEN